MEPYPLRVIGNSYVFLDPDDDCEAAAKALEECNYSEDLCIGRDFESGFIARLMAAGFLVMSEVLSGASPEEGNITILLPKHHLVRSCLFFPDLHIKKSIRSKLSLYDLRFDSDFDIILDKCLAIHGRGWLTAPLVDALREMRAEKKPPVRPVSFGLYRNGELRAGEFGIIAGRIYTSYSGYFEETNAGTAQMILTAQYLERNSFAFWFIKRECSLLHCSTSSFWYALYDSGSRARGWRISCCCYKLGCSSKYYKSRRVVT